ncbi:MAG: hypothetical protein MOGMAGMI_01855 [Candidatus Omnitrophica bacterium]|nr:hypothetical protein [Candidatus Omnitrophota bacterium]
MAYTPNSPILTTDPQLLDTQALAAYVNRLGAYRSLETREYIEAVTSGALRMGIDPVVVLSQWWLETDAGRSQWWNRTLNPAGIGITGDPKQNAASQTWPNGTQAAYGHLAHLGAYLWGDDLINHWPMSWPDPSDVDKRLAAPIRAGYEASTLADLNGTWAVDPQNAYDTKLANRANAIVRDFAKEQEPMADLVYGRVPHPPYTRNIIRKDVINGQGHGHTPISGGRGRPVGCIHHEWMDGGEEGEAFYTKFFRCPDGARHANALVDYFIMRSGKIVMINDPEGDRIPWASGGSGPYQGDGGAFVRKFGAQAVNRRLVSWEYCKRNNDNLTDAQVQAGGLLAAYWHDHDEQPWDQHPYVPKYGCVTSLLHHEVQGTDCGLDMYDDISKVQEVTRQQMKKYQTASTPTTPAPPTYAPRHPMDAGTRVVNDRLYLGVTESYVLARDATPREWAEPASKPTGPDLKKGAIVQTSHVVKDIGIESDLTLVLVNGDRIPASVVQGGE